MPSALRMRSMAMVFFPWLVLISCSCFSSSLNNTNYSSISSIRCHAEERAALLGFINSITFNYSDPFSIGRTWKKESDCCGWDGITCDPTSHHVVELDLIECGLIGTLDSNNTLFHLHHLRFLDLSYNDLLKMKTSTFHGIISNLTHLTALGLGGVNINSTIPPSLTNLSSLTGLDLTECNLRGELPANILLMPQLQYMYLGGNKDLYANFPLSNWSTSLMKIDLSNVNFSSKLPQYSPVQYQPTQLESLDLSGCSFYGRIPDWMWHMTMRNDTRLKWLDLSNNKFNGSINLNDIQFKFPNLNITTSLLNTLDISYNYLTGRVTSLPWNYLSYLDLSNNMFNGPLPIPHINVTWFTASNNNFTGPLPSLLCNLTSLQVLDLAKNSLKEEIPHCLGNLINNLIVLNLGSNNISGCLSNAIFSNCSLEYLDLSFNFFKGLVPRMLSHCQELEVLNLRSNKFLDEFPHWLGTLSQIQVLDLSHNVFFGSLQPSDVFFGPSEPSDTISFAFPQLQVLDLSNNNLSGKIPNVFFEVLQAMMKVTRSAGSPEYMTSMGVSYYYSITLTFNGVEFQYKKIITTLTTFDLANNKFEGEIPNNIGKLVSLHGLNLSHNQFIGPIPPSLGNLSSLNSLDLSFNKLTGKIPQELASLSSLGVFRVSNNQLEGPIPNDNHFETFPVDSYEGNPSLCGFPLPECGEHGRPRPLPSQNDNEDADAGTLSEWRVVMMGCGFGAFVSFAWGYYMLSIARPLLLFKLVLVIVDLLERDLFGRRRRRPRRGRN